MKTILVVASNSPTSINLDVAKKIKEKFPQVSIYETKDLDVIMFRQDYIEKSFPDAINSFMKTLLENDNIVFITPEYNSYLPPHFKNIMDWASVSPLGMKWLPNKNALIVSASPGSTGGSTVREFFGRTLPYTGVNLIKTIGIPLYTKDKNIDDIINEIGSALNL
ncbi:NADPH-dependent FMN reductase [Malacoplasma iowae]|uniref:NADPH-dependent FMN reductase n=1 Tax=Malacoplasma iowae TaxID=2116 RepID=UPI0038735B34|nr:NADPH-dependent FMN reductase [Malacoplasma iowae]